MSIILNIVRIVKYFMDKMLNYSRLWGPVLTVVFTVIYHIGVIRGWYEVSLSLIFLFVAAGAFISGLRGGLAAAVWGSAYGWYVMLPGSRLLQTIIGMVALAGLVGWRTRQIRKYYQSIDVMYNGNKHKLEQALAYIREAKGHARVAGKMLDLGEDRLGNALAGVVGYKAVADIIHSVEEWHNDPANIEKMRQMDAVKESESHDESR